MRNRPMIFILAIALLAAMILTGCTDPQNTVPSTPSLNEDTHPTEPTTPADPTDPAPEITDIQQLISSVYVTVIHASYSRLDTPNLEELSLTITRYADGQDVISMDMTHMEGVYYYELDFQNPENTFTLQRPDPDQPIYYIHSNVHLKDSKSSTYVNFFIDFETQTMLFRPNSVPAHYYTVASVDPTADPYAILEHFLPHLEAMFPPWEGMEETMYPIPEQTEKHFCYDLTGAWLSVDGQPLGNMDFCLIGNFPIEYRDGKDVERNLTFLWPEDFEYENAKPVSQSITVAVQEERTNFHGVGLLQNTQSGDLATFWFNIFPEEEIVILQMDGKYLISSTRSDMDAASILSRYQNRLISHDAQAVNWEMTAYLLKADGTVMETTTMSVTGYIWEYTDRYSRLVLDIDYPDDFRFDTTIPQPYGNYGYRIPNGDPTEYWFGDLAYDKVTNYFGDSNCAINTEKEYFIGIFDEGQIRYVVACTDSNVTAEDILEHFQNFLEVHQD